MTKPNNTRQYVSPAKRTIIGSKTRREYEFFSTEIGCVVKRCTVCALIKPIENFLLIRSRAKFRRVAFCNPCRLAYKRAYRRGQQIKRTKVATKRCTRCGIFKSPEDCHSRRNVCLRCLSVKTANEWVAMTPEKKAKELESLRCAARSYFARNRKTRIEANRQYAKKHPEVQRETLRRRRARQVMSPLIEKFDRASIIERDKGICYICGKKPPKSKLTLDHLIPLARGGTHTVDNLRVACHACNCRKHTKLPSEVETYMPLLTTL